MTPLGPHGGLHLSDQQDQSSLNSTQARPPPSRPSESGSKRPELTVRTSKNADKEEEEHQQHDGDHQDPSSLSPGSTAQSISPNQRSSSHTRSQSMTDHIQRSPPPVSQASGGDLVRRHHTLSTSSSRLVRLERSRARLALQGVGLSEEDQEYYVPPSPVGFVGQPAAWSDLGHGSSSSSAVSAGGLAVLSNHSRTPSATSSMAAAWGGSEVPSLPSTPDPLHSTFPLTSSPASTASLERSPVPAAAAHSTKRSAFVVVRSGKGDSALLDRRTPLSPPAHQPLRQVSPPSLQHRNSLKPFLEAEGRPDGEQEEWERSIQVERDREEFELMRGRSSSNSLPEPPQDSYLNQSFTSPALSSGSFQQRGTSPFGAHVHSRSNSQRQSIGSVGSDAAWAPSGEEAAALRRHQSLTFRSSSQQEDDDEGGWPRPHDRGASEEVLGSLALASASFSRSRSGTGPPNLVLQSSLTHSNSLPSSHYHHHAPAGGSGNLSHSNSFSSHGHSGTLSPVGGFSRSPWSPTVEESMQFGGMSAAVGTPPLSSGGRLSRGGSESSRGSTGHRPHAGRGVSEEDLVESMTGMELGSTSRENGLPVTPPAPSLDARGPHLGATSPSSRNGGDFVRREPVRSATLSGPTTSGTGSTSRNRLPPLLTSPEVLNSPSSPSGSTANLKTATQPNSNLRQGPASAAAYVPPIGHSHLPPQSRLSAAPESPLSATGAATGGGADWHRQKEMVTGSGAASASLPSPSPFSTAVGVNPLEEKWPADGGFGVGLAMQQQQQIQLLQSQMQQAMQVMDLMKSQGHIVPNGMPANLPRNGTPFSDAPTPVPMSMQMPMPVVQPMVTSLPSNGPPLVAGVNGPIDIPTLVAQKGYNPSGFDLRPPSARFFVIKSYTEEDVHRSLKHEIWASTDLGNKRLDRAFRESADKGPIYLFFSVNASGHFAGMAQMLSPVDSTTSSTVWASDKWKGVLKVRWIYIKDVPLASLRHIRLSNTPENKPVTSSRDTQEVPYEAGLEVLRILATYNSRTSLLQDFAWYDARSNLPAATSGAPASAASPPPHQPHYAPRAQSQPHQAQQQPPQQFQQQQQLQQPFYPPQQLHPYSPPPPPPHLGGPSMMNGPPPPILNGGRRYNNQVRGHTPPGAAMY